jgi:hypothetical protein
MGPSASPYTGIAFAPGPEAGGESTQTNLREMVRGNMKVTKAKALKILSLLDKGITDDAMLLRWWCWKTRPEDWAK